MADRGRAAAGNPQALTPTHAHGLADAEGAVLVQQCPNLSGEHRSLLLPQKGRSSTVCCYDCTYMQARQRYQEELKAGMKRCPQ